MTKQELENNMTKVAGIPVEITVRGKRSFTFSFEGKNETAAKKIQQYFAPVSLEYDYDEEKEIERAQFNGETDEDIFGGWGSMNDYKD